MARRVELDRHVLQTNLLANIVILLTGAVSLLVILGIVIRRGSAAPMTPRRCDWIVVLGHALDAGTPSPDFRARLDRALDLCRRLPTARVIVLGGTVPGQPCSEATAGSTYLEAHGLAPERIVVEDSSRHTLENFQRSLALLRDNGANALALVTNRYHLARSVTMARNLGLRVIPCPAEQRWSLRAGLLGKVLWEAYLLHWYHVGRLYALTTGNAGMLARVYPRRPGG